MRGVDKCICLSENSSYTHAWTFIWFDSLTWKYDDTIEDESFILCKKKGVMLNLFSVPFSEPFSV